jgi:hypothetical protein
VGPQRRNQASVVCQKHKGFLHTRRAETGYLLHTFVTDVQQPSPFCTPQMQGKRQTNYSIDPR